MRTRATSRESLKKHQSSKRESFRLVRRRRRMPLRMNNLKSKLLHRQVLSSSQTLTRNLSNTRIIIPTKKDMLNKKKPPKNRKEKGDPVKNLSSLLKRRKTCTSSFRELKSALRAPSKKPVSSLRRTSLAALLSKTISLS